MPNLTDSPPFAGSSTDTAAVKPPYGPDESVNYTATAPDTVYQPEAGQTNLTFATLPLSFMGNQIAEVIKNDQHLPEDIADVGFDILKIGTQAPVSWGWYQQGYGPEPFDGQPASIDGLTYSQGTPEHASYIVHHNGPQYFGYLGDNTAVQSHLHGLQQFFNDVKGNALPAGGGVFYVRGGYYNNDGMKPADPNATVQVSTPGNDDHPNYSDAGISEAQVADAVNAIASSPYWNQSAIIVTYDETDGLYEHVPEQFRTYGPDGKPETGGPRIPAIVISPYAAAHTVSHVYSEHSAVIRFIDEMFHLTPLAALPDEAAARQAGAEDSAFNGPNGPQKNLGPADDPRLLDYKPGMGDLLEAFDDERLQGSKPALSASYAMITESPPPGITLNAPSSDVLTSLPHFAGTDANHNPTFGCQYLGITPTDYPNGYARGTEIDPPPQDFNPRPTQSPGEPYLNINNNTAADPASASTGAWDPPASP